MKERDVNKKSSLFRRFWKEYAYIYGLFAFAVVSPLLATVGEQTAFLISHNIPAAVFVCIVLLTVLGIPSVFALVKYLLSGLFKKGTRFFDGCYLFMMVFLFAQNLLNKKCTGLFLSGKVEAFVYLLLGIILASTCTFFYLKKIQIRELFRFLAIGVILFPLHLFLFSPASRVFSSIDSKKVGAVEVKNPVPIVMVIFDEFSLVALLDSKGEIDDVRYPNFAQLAKTSCWFPNAVSTVNQTMKAIPQILTSINYKPSVKKNANISDHPDNFFTWLNNTYSFFNIHEYQTKLAPDELIASSFNLKQFISDFFSLPFYSYLHEQHEKYLLPQLPASWKGFGLFYHEETEAHSMKKTYKNFLSSLRKGKSLNYLHLELPHIPLIFLPSGKYYESEMFFPIGVTNSGTEMSQTPSICNVSYHQYLLQAGYTDKIVGEIIETMKKKKIFNNALLIITSDHGASYDYRAKYWRYLGPEAIAYNCSIPLFIKLPQQKYSRTIKTRVTSVDILPTVARVIKAKTHWRINGFDVLSPDYPEKESLIFYDRIVPGLWEYKSEKIKTELKKVLVLKKSIFGERKPYSETNVNYTEHHEYDFLLGNSINSFTVTENKKLVLKVNFSQGESRSFITGRVISDVSKNEDIYLAAAADNKIFAITKTAKWLNWNNFFAAMIPEGYLNQNVTVITAYKIKKTNFSFELSKVFSERIVNDAQLNLKQLNKKFNSLSKTLLPWKPKTISHNIIAYNKDVASIKTGTSAVIINSKGTDAHFHLIPLSIASNASCLMRIDFTFPEENVWFQVFYQTKHKPYYTEKQSVLRTILPKGRNVFFMEIPGPDLNGQLRIDFSNKPGKYIIHSLEIRELPLPGSATSSVLYSRSENMLLKLRPEHLADEISKLSYHINHVETNSSGLIFNATGGDPHFMLPWFPISTNVNLIMKVDITPPRATTLQVFYQTKKKMRFCEEQSIRIHLKNGKNTILLKIPGPGLSGRMRLDPGCTKGKYIIHNLEILEQPLSITD